jgi:hypothetical protein
MGDTTSVCTLRRGQLHATHNSLQFQPENRLIKKTQTELVKLGVTYAGENSIHSRTDLQDNRKTKESGKVGKAIHNLRNQETSNEFISENRMHYKMFKIMTATSVLTTFRYGYSTTPCQTFNIIGAGLTH